MEILSYYMKQYISKLRKYHNLLLATPRLLYKNLRVTGDDSYDDVPIHPVLRSVIYLIVPLTNKDLLLGKNFWERPIAFAVTVYSVVLHGHSTLVLCLEQEILLTFVTDEKSLITRLDWF